MTPLETMLKLARDAGCPPDQVRNFKRAGYCPQPVQLPFHAAAREADDPNRMSGETPQVAMGGGRGGTKSHAAICQAVHDDCVRCPGLKWLYLRSVGKSARESFEDMLVKALPGMMQYYKTSRSRLELPNGSIAILGGFRNDRDIDQYIGLEYDGIIIDDAHLVSAEKHKKILGSIRTSKQNWRPRAYLTFNPGGVGHAYLKDKFIRPWREQRQNGTRFFFSLPEDNKFLNPEYLAYLDGLTGWLYQAWRLGDFDIAAGQFFTTWRHDVHVIKSDAVKLRPHWTWWAAMDYGFTHPTVVYLFTRSNDGTVYVVDEHWQQKWLVPRHAVAIHAMLGRHGLSAGGLKSFPAGGDVFAREGRSETTPAQQYEREGIKLIWANMARINGAARVLELLGDVEHGVDPRLYILDRCRRLIECLPSLEHDPHRPEDVLKTDVDDGGLGGDDAYDALRYGLMEIDNLVVQGVRAY